MGKGDMGQLMIQIKPSLSFHSCANIALSAVAFVLLTLNSQDLIVNSPL